MSKQNLPSWVIEGTDAIILRDYGYHAENAEMIRCTISRITKTMVVVTVPTGHGGQHLRRFKIAEGGLFEITYGERTPQLVSLDLAA